MHYNERVRSQSPVFLIASSSIVAAIVLLTPGCRGILGIGDESDGTAANDAGTSSAGGEGGNVADGQTLPGPIDGSPGGSLDGSTGSGTDGGGTGADAGPGSSGIDARYAAWIPGPETPTQLTKTSGGTIVVDGLTGLWWEQTNVAFASDLPGAKAYCSKVSLGGMKDWRVPTRIELMSIVDFNAQQRLAAIFGSPQSGQWTQSQLIGDPLQSFVVDFVSNATFSLITNSTSVNSTNYVRCVRNGRPLPKSPAAPLPAGLWVAQGNYVQNTQTGQLWEKTPPTTPGNYASAMQHCSSLGGAFRVPTIRDLDTLTDESRVAAPAWPAVFDGMAGEYWSQTMDGSDPYTWKTSGLFSVQTQNQVSMYVRCVSP